MGSDVLKVWNTRYLMLIPRNKTLVYYTTRPKTEHQQSKGGYDLSDGISLRDLPKIPNGFMICVPGKNDIVLGVPSQKDKKKRLIRSRTVFSRVTNKIGLKRRN